MINQIDTVLYTGKTHTTGGRNGEARSDDGRLDINCPRRAVQAVAPIPNNCWRPVGRPASSAPWARRLPRMKVSLPSDITVDAEIDLGKTEEAFFLQARLNVSLPGLDPAIARAVVDDAHLRCPYSKAPSGNIDITINLV